MPEFVYMVEVPSGGLPEKVARLTGLLDRLPKGIRAKSYDGVLGRGVLCVHESGVSDSRFAVDMDRQEWTVEEVEGVRVHVGMWLDWIPTEADLRREKVLDSDAVSFPSRREVWLVPRLRARDGAACLPHAYSVGSAGAAATVARQYRHLDSCGERLFRQWEFETVLRDEGVDETTAEYGRRVVEHMGDHAITVADQIRIAVEALSANYRVGPAEVGLLELVTEHTLPDIVAALLCRYQARRILQLLEVEKKIRDATECAELVANLESGIEPGATADAGRVVASAGA